MKKSDRIISTILCKIANEEKDKRMFGVEERLEILEGLIRHIIDNELAHIWLFIKLCLGGVFSILTALLIKFLTE